MSSLRTLLALFQISVRSRAQYATTFLLSLVTSLLMFAAEFSLVYFLGIKVGAINGWTPGQLTLLYVAMMLAGSLEVAFTTNLRNFAHEIISGELDLKLLRPVHPLLLIMGRVAVDAVAIPLFCLLVLLLTLQRTAEYWTLFTVAWYLTSIVGGALIFSSLTIVSSALAFWTYDSNSFYEITRKGTRQLLWYPLDIYSTPVRLFLTFVLPLAFVSYIPVHLVIGQPLTFLPQWFAYLTLPVGVLCVLMATWLWHRGLRQYQGTGS